MLTRLRLKNWRSLQDVVIDNLKPLTVFIGANSSGKSNILDALHFLRDCNEQSVVQAIGERSDVQKIHTMGQSIDSPIEIEFTYRIGQNRPSLNYVLALLHNDGLPHVKEQLWDEAGQVYLKADSKQGGFVSKSGLTSDRHSIPPLEWTGTALSTYGHDPDGYREVYETLQYITQRWQLLDENFMPPLRLPSTASGDRFVIDRCADNMLLMLEFMKKVDAQAFASLQQDLRWLLTHVNTLETRSDAFEKFLVIRESVAQSAEAPTISAGTARLVAMLTAYYALEIQPQRAAMPGLLVLEEPDTALNPWLLSRFVEQLRNYADREFSRQFILTTHNPRLLDNFQPEEVRIVQRDEDGLSAVLEVPEYIRDIWLDEYKLGQVWSTGSLGAVPQ